MRCRIRRLHAAFWLVGAHEKHVERLGKTRQAGRSESSPIGLFGRATERALRARGAHLAENADRGPRCGARILRVLERFVMDDSLTCGFSSWQERAFPDMVERSPHSLSNEAPLAAFSAKRGHFLCNRAPYWRFLPGESVKVGSRKSWARIEGD